MHVNALFQYERVKVEVVATEASLSFFDHKEVERTGVRVWRNNDEWGTYVSCTLRYFGYDNMPLS